uniref:Uncharacterized protein n=1 Tax=Arundo donax TaxID=35708 RepID=A0A0A9FZG6_ARUDO
MPLRGQLQCSAVQCGTCSCKCDCIFHCSKVSTLYSTENSSTC